VKTRETAATRAILSIELHSARCANQSLQPSSVKQFVDEGIVFSLLLGRMIYGNLEKLVFLTVGAL
jgi:hypothetical protein